MTCIDHIPESALERLTTALVDWLVAETRLTFGFEPMRAVTGAPSAYQLTETRWTWNGMGSDVDEDVLAAGTLDDVHAVVLRIVGRFNREVRL